MPNQLYFRARDSVTNQDFIAIDASFIKQLIGIHKGNWFLKNQEDLKALIHRWGGPFPSEIEDNSCEVKANPTMILLYYKLK